MNEYLLNPKRVWPPLRTTSLAARQIDLTGLQRGGLRAGFQ